ncbi:MAG: 2-oxoacid:acceptor oxidoreductase subunit alpha [Candidatus Thorarchaeota archaeon]
MDITFNIGGEAGQGIDTIGDLLTQIFVQVGFYTFTVKDFESRIRGGYNFTQIRVSDRPVVAPVEEVHIIVALSKDAIIGQRDRLVDGGVIIFDDSIVFNDIEACHFPAPLEKTAVDIGGDVRMTNAAALGAVLSVIKFPFGLAEEALTNIFGRKGEKVVSGNIAVARTLYDMTAEKFTGSCSQDLAQVKKGPSTDRFIVTGNRALALGAMAANVKWVSSYPMSPSTSLFQDMVANAHRLKIGTLQTEDEIASILMAIGASYAGARSMVTTSGGGFSLMVEGMGLAAMAEVPIVIYNAQRPGPSTGLPTRTEQADLLFTAFSSQGEFPRIVLAPKDPEEGLEIAVRSFDLTEKYQVPVIILGDQYFADSAMNIAKPDVTGTKIDRGKIAGPKSIPGYERYKFTEDGVSPRAFPGSEGVTVVSSGNAHLENGHITEDPNIRDMMVEKFFKKVPHILKDLKPPEIFGPKEADVTLLTWGSTWGAVFEAVETLSSRNTSVNQLHFCDVYPLQTQTLHEVFEKSKKVISVEMNATSQFADLVRMKTGLTVHHQINKYDGRPMTAAWVIRKLKEVGVE